MRPVFHTAMAILAPAALVVAAAPPALAAADTRADLGITKTANRRTVGSGQDIVYTITLTNLGPDTAQNIVFGDPLPDELNLVDAARSDKCDPGGPDSVREHPPISSEGTIGLGAAQSETYCGVRRLERGESATLILVTVPVAGLSEEQIKNTAFIEGAATPDSERMNNSASVTVSLR